MVIGAAGAAAEGEEHAGARVAVKADELADGVEEEQAVLGPAWLVLGLGLGLGFGLGLESNPNPNPSPSPP